MSQKPTTVIDPVCGMTVTVAKAEAAGLTLERDGRIYAFCGPGCRRAFVEEPSAYDGSAADGPSPATLASASSPTGAQLPVIDEGMRRWYEACSCCLSEAFPEVKAQLDAERAAAAAATAGPGICEIAEGTATEVGAQA